MIRPFACECIVDETLRNERTGCSERVSRKDDPGTVAVLHEVSYFRFE